MLKIAFSGSRINFLRHLVVRLTCQCSCEYNVAQKNSLIKTSQFYNIHQRNNSNDSRIRNFYEYPDLNTSEDETRIPYTNWEGVENRYAHSIMEKNKLYDETITIIPNANSDKYEKMSESELEDLLTRNYRLESISNLINNFRAISHHAMENNSDIYDEKYVNIIDSISNDSKNFTAHELCHVLQSLTLWFIESNEDDTSFSRLYKALDTECKYRIKFWSIERILFVCDHWYRLRLITRSKFMLHAIVNLGQNPELSSRNLVQLMFYSSVLRNMLMNPTKVETQLESKIDDLDINEIAIVALGFFKTQTMIRDRKLLAIMIQRTIEEIDGIHEISLTAILKVVRYSININDMDFLCKLLENTIPQIPRLSVTCAAHILFAAAHRSIFYAELLNAVTAKFYSEISKLRIKDIKFLTFALSSFNYVPEKQPDIFDRVIEELNESKRENELKNYAPCFASCLRHLSILNIHPKNLIAKALDPKRIRRSYGSNVNTKRDILVLDLNVEAESPDYQGPRLDSRTRKGIAMRLTDSAPYNKARLTIADHFMLDVMKSCEEYLGSKEMIHVDHILPQYQRPDIIICFDKMNSPIPLSSTLSELPFGNVKHPPKISSHNSIKWVVLVMGSNNSYATNTNRMMGNISAKYRQLQHIGYKPYIIIWHDWMRLSNDAEKIKYLRFKVFS